MQYVDGRGWESVASRSANYCPHCQHNPPSPSSPVSSADQSGDNQLPLTPASPSAPVLPAIHILSPIITPNNQFSPASVTSAPPALQPKECGHTGCELDLTTGCCGSCQLLYVICRICYLTSGWPSLSKCGPIRLVTWKSGCSKLLFILPGRPTLTTSLGSTFARTLRPSSRKSAAEFAT